MKNKKLIIWISVAVGALIITGLGGFLIWKNLKINDKSNQDGTQADTDTSEQPLLFTYDMFDINRVKHIVPLGELNGGYIETQTITGIMVQMKNEYGKPVKEMAVYAPTDMVLTNYAYYTYGDEPENWSLVFKLNNKVSMTLDHITRTVPKIIEATTDTPVKNQSNRHSVKEEVSFKAGEIIAYTTGTSLAKNWNIYFTDKSHENNFININRFRNSQNGNQYLNSICPFDYYSEEMQKPYIALMGATAAGQSKSCGTVSRDVKGSISGLWFLTDEGFEAKYEENYATPFSIYKDSAGRVVLYEVE